MTRIEEDRIESVKIATSLGFKGKSFLITGATGMIGRNLLSVLKRITDEKNIFVIGRDFEESKSFCYGTQMIPSSFEVMKTINQDIDYIFHFASPTSSSYMANNPVETIDFIYQSTKSILDFACKHKSQVLFASSMEVYGVIDNDKMRSEDDLGFLSLKNTRNSYSETKRLCELLVRSYCSECNLKAFTARLAQTFGAGSSIDDPRIFGYLSRCAKNNENIILKTNGLTIGNYCYLNDSIRAFFYILSKGEPGETYNIVGDNCRCTILDMANMVANRIAGGKIKVIINESDSNIFPDSTKLRMDNLKLKQLGWKPRYDLFDMYQRMINSDE